MIQSWGGLSFGFYGTVLTEADDQKTRSVDLTVEVKQETCSWLTQPIADWFSESVCQAAKVEFNRYITAGDLEQTKKRIEEIQAKSDDTGGFVGMYL